MVCSHDAGRSFAGLKSQSRVSGGCRASVALNPRQGHRTHTLARTFVQLSLVSQPHATRPDAFDMRAYQVGLLMRAATTRPASRLTLRYRGWTSSTWNAFGRLGLCGR
jgi:hypothetical protein